MSVKLGNGFWSGFTCQVWHANHHFCNSPYNHMNARISLWQMHFLSLTRPRECRLEACGDSVRVGIPKMKAIQDEEAGYPHPHLCHYRIVAILDLGMLHIGLGGHVRQVCERYRRQHLMHKRLFSVGRLSSEDIGRTKKIFVFTTIYECLQTAFPKPLLSRFC